MNWHSKFKKVWVVSYFAPNLEGAIELEKSCSLDFSDFWKLQNLTELFGVS